ncbi:MAG TPA: hypothetical protein VFT69_15490 [Pseudolabrys sp.]|nr:hypothetical protein [Pseudolabrys sp.]
MMIKRIAIVLAAAVFNTGVGATLVVAQGRHEARPYLVRHGGPTPAHSIYRAPPQCVDRPVDLSLGHILFAPPPQPNGCAPPVYFDGAFVGQDPDPNIRLQLRRDPDSGHANSDMH